MIFLIIIVLFLGFMAASVVAANRKILRQMRTEITVFRGTRNSPLAEDKEIVRSSLYALKRKVWVGDKKSIEIASDLISEFEKIGE